MPRHAKRASWQGHARLLPYDTTTRSSSPQIEQPLLPRAVQSSWSYKDDMHLTRLRQIGHNWSTIAAHFVHKTPNACRKRHERLMERQSCTDSWDADRYELLAKEYIAARQQMWHTVADRMGEKWALIEWKCMEKGVKNLQNLARAANRRESTSEQATCDHYMDDAQSQAVQRSHLNLPIQNEIAVVSAASEASGSPSMLYASPACTSEDIPCIIPYQHHSMTPDTGAHRRGVSLGIDLIRHVDHLSTSYICNQRELPRALSVPTERGDSAVAHSSSVTLPSFKTMFPNLPTCSDTL